MTHAMKTRVQRSRTGCQACRRRKVRCDERKPTCSACFRLQLDCVFQPGTGVPTETAGRRFHLRFVTSPYVHKRAELERAKDKGEAAPAKNANQVGANVPEAATVSPVSPAVQPEAALRPCATEPLAAPSGDALHDALVQYPSSTSMQSLPLMLPCAPADPMQTASGFMPLYFDLNMNFDLLDNTWMGFPESSGAEVGQLGLLAPLEPMQAATMATSVVDACDMPQHHSSPSSRGVSPSATSTTTVLPERGRIVLEEHDNVLIQHYLNVMTKFAKIRGSGEDNIYTLVFSNLALFYKPLYNAIMAWTGLHMGQVLGHPKTTPVPQAMDDVAESASPTQTRHHPTATSSRKAPEILSPSSSVDPKAASLELTRRAGERYKRAMAQLHEDQDVAYQLELPLLTLWFLLQFELLAARGIDYFFRHLEFAADLVDVHRRHQRAGGAAATLSPIGARVLIWLGTYDARATWIGGSGRLLQTLELFTSEYDFLEAAFPAVPGATAKTAADTADLKGLLRLTLEFDTLDNRIAQLFHRPAKLVSTTLVATWRSLHRDLLSIQQRLEDHPCLQELLAQLFPPCSKTVRSRTAVSAISTQVFNALLLLSACYSVIISFHHTIPPVAALALRGVDFPSAEMAAMRILRIASMVGRLRPPSPQNVWPRILFIAGIETSDCVYQDWVIKTLAEADEKGMNLAKTRTLLRHVIQKQSVEGRRINYLDVMRETTGMFII